MSFAGLRHVSFDKDGVLTDVHSYWAHNSRLRAKALAARARLPDTQCRSLVAAMGIDDGSDRIKPGGPVGYEPRPTVIKAAVDCLAGLGRALSPEEVSEVFRAIDAAQQSSGDYRISLLPGVREALDGLRALGLVLSIYSSDRSENTRKVLGDLGLADRFAAIVGGGDVARPKPDPEGFLRACSAVGASPSESAYVSDTASDLRMARAGGAALRVGVTSGLDGRAALEAEADRVVDRLDEVL